MPKIIFADILLVGIGGSIGAISRFLFGEFCNQLLGRYFSSFARFPFATFGVNFIGCFLAGMLYYCLIYGNLNNFLVKESNIQKFALIGFLGGFTTFSTFSIDFLRLFLAGQTFLAIIYSISTLIFTILAVFLGFYLMSFFA